MQTLETLRRQINSTESLHSVVRTMKVLSMTSIRQCEEAVESLTDYNRTVRLGLQIALRHRPRDGAPLPTASSGRLGVIVFGSAWGMCGRFNENLAQHTAERLAATDDPTTTLVLGEYVGGALEAQGLASDHQSAGPESVEGITARVQELLIKIEQWRLHQKVDRVLLFYNQSTSGASYDPTTQRLLPLDESWLHQLEQETWPTRQVPTFRGDWEALFASLVRQYFFVSLYRAFAESLASEHASRLAAMQMAETNVEERLDDLQSRFHRTRQNAITEELLDITSGFEALRTVYEPAHDPNAQSGS
jgi:F-type H+-transporting ATPase subunit gamma